MRKILSGLVALFMIVLSLPQSVYAGGGIYASGGGYKTVGQTFTVNVTASGATFDSFTGNISVSGPVSVVSIYPGNCDAWITKPSNGGTFNGAFLGRKVSSLTVATVTLKGTSLGSGSVSISGAQLLSAGSVVGSGSSNASYTITKAPDYPSNPTVTSPSHPNPKESYEDTTVELTWNKEKGVTGFSYFLDDKPDTTPTAKIDSDKTSITYKDKKIGTYYFHIRAKNADGWSGTTHFKITIKEPDPKINEGLQKPTDIELLKSADFVNDIDKGEITGLIIKGRTESNFDVNISLSPEIKLPKDVKMTTKSDLDGVFEYVFDFPVPAGFYTMTIQGQDEKTLTPMSDEIKFELSVKSGGTINLITEDDRYAPEEVKSESTGQRFELNKEYLLYASCFVVLILLVIVIVWKFVKKNKAKKLLRTINKNNND